MSVINISCSKDGLQVGNFKRKLLVPSWDSCNEPWKDRYWCPKLKWFRAKPCPFINRHDCVAWEDQCYGKTY